MSLLPTNVVRLLVSAGKKEGNRGLDARRDPAGDHEQQDSNGES